MRKSKMNMKTHIKHAKTDKTQNKRSRKSRNNKSRNNKSRNKIKIPTKIKGGNNPFSGISGIFGTINYNLSNAMSTFTITPPSSPINPSDKVIDPSPGKHYL